VLLSARRSRCHHTVNGILNTLRRQDPNDWRNRVINTPAKRRWVLKKDVIRIDPRRKKRKGFGRQRQAQTVTFNLPATIGEGDPRARRSRIAVSTDGVEKAIRKQSAIHGSSKAHLDPSASDHLQTVGYMQNVVMVSKLEAKDGVP